MIEINNVTFQYKAESSSGGIRNISLSIPQGEVVVLCGESGCGKTTITRLINGLIPHFFEGELSGSVLVNGQNVSVQPLYDTAKLVGSVFQNPRSQFFNVDTTSELSFGCENLGKTVVLSEHRLYYLRGIADRYIYVKDGSIAAVYTADQFDRISEDERSTMGLRTNDLSSLRGNTTAGRSTASALLNNFHFAYKHAPETLRIDSCEIPYGGIIGIIGHNGAGKSTFSRCFCGLEKRCGTVTVNGTSHRPKDRLNNCYMVMQEVGHQLFTESVLDEVLISMADENEDIARSILEKLDLSSLADRHPASLSGGQKQRLAIASAIAAKRPVVFLDEPTSGLDYRHMTEVAELLKSLHKDGKTIYVITHDPELICECCTDILHLEDGTITECYPMDAAGVNKIRDFFRIA